MKKNLQSMIDLEELDDLERDQLIKNLLDRISHQGTKLHSLLCSVLLMKTDKLLYQECNSMSNSLRRFCDYIEDNYL